MSSSVINHSGAPVGAEGLSVRRGPLVKPTLGLLGATVNAMALIAPGAFLWITYQLQAAATAPNGASVAGDIWGGIVVALGVAFLTALSYSELARLYPEAGFAGCVYFAEKAFLDRQAGVRRSAPDSLARLSKLATGWSAHLFYWVYPGVMVAFMATLIGYIYSQITGQTLSNIVLTVIAVAFAAVTGAIAYRGVTGSTRTALWINVIQLVTLVVFSALAIWYRLANPQHAHWAFTGAWDVIRPHSVQGVLVQSTLAILILVGFESCTSLSAETKNPGKTIPQAIIISLLIQGVLAYLLEYFAAAYMISDQLTATGATGAVAGIGAAAVSAAPLGDMVKLIGDSLLPGVGFGLMVTMAFTVGIAIVGTTLSCMNTAMRISAGMAEQRELPTMFGFIHQRFGTPHMALGALIVVTSVIAAIGVRSVVGLTGIALASNFGTFILYGLTCAWTIIAYSGGKKVSILKHRLIPGLGIVANLVMAAAIIYLYSIGNADSQREADICFLIAGAWALVSLVYVAITTVQRSYRLKMVSCVLRPEYLNIVTQALKEDDLIMGMTVTKVKGFGRQHGSTHEDTDGPADRVTFIAKIRVDIVVKDWDVQRVMDIIGEAVHTGNIGDGKIFVLDATDAMRISTGEKGVWAV